VTVRERYAAKNIARRTYHRPEFAKNRAERRARNGAFGWLPPKQFNRLARGTGATLRDEPKKNESDAEAALAAMIALANEGS